MKETTSTRLLVNVGYEYAFIPKEKLKGIPLKKAWKINVDGAELAVFKGETFTDSQKLDELFDSEEIETFRILTVK